MIIFELLKRLNAHDWIYNEHKCLCLNVGYACLLRWGVECLIIDEWLCLNCRKVWSFMMRDLNVECEWRFCASVHCLMCLNEYIIVMKCVHVISYYFLMMVSVTTQFQGTWPARTRFMAQPVSLLILCPVYISYISFYLAIMAHFNFIQHSYIKC